MTRRTACTARCKHDTTSLPTDAAETRPSRSSTRPDNTRQPPHGTLMLTKGETKKQDGQSWSTLDRLATNFTRHGTAPWDPRTNTCQTRCELSLKRPRSRTNPINQLMI
eukprot:UN3578